jgi:hypothetical protein
MSEATDEGAQSAMISSINAGMMTSSGGEIDTITTSTTDAAGVTTSHTRALGDPGISPVTTVTTGLGSGGVASRQDPGRSSSAATSPAGPLPSSLSGSRPAQASHGSSTKQKSYKRISYPWKRLEQILNEIADQIDRNKVVAGYGIALDTSHPRQTVIIRTAKLSADRPPSSA